MYKTIEAIYENGEIKLLEDINVKKAKLYITIIESNKENIISDDLNDVKILSCLTARTIKEWQNDEEDDIWQ